MGKDVLTKTEDLIKGAVLKHSDGKWSSGGGWSKGLLLRLPSCSFSRTSPVRPPPPLLALLHPCLPLTLLLMPLPSSCSSCSHSSSRGGCKGGFVSTNYRTPPSSQSSSLSTNHDRPKFRQHHCCAATKLMPFAQVNAAAGPVFGSTNRPPPSILSVRAYRLQQGQGTV